MSDTEARRLPAAATRRLAPVGVIVVGVLLVPMALALAANSWSTPDAEAYVRMAFAQVAGATIALVTVVGLAVQRVLTRQRAADIATFVLIAVAVGSSQLTALAAAGDTLLTRLGVS